MAQSDERDLQWLAQVAEGGRHAEAAMNQLFKAYQPRFLGWLCFDGLPLHEAKDILQRVWMDVWRKAGSRPADATPSAWLWSFLLTARKDAYSEKKRRDGRTVPLDEQDMSLELQDALRDLGPASAETQQAQGDVRRCIQRAFAGLKRLQPEAASLLYAFHVNGWSLAQVALARRSTPGATSEFLSQARRLFRPLALPCLELLKA